MKKRKWIVICPACEEEVVELDEKKLLINDSKIISHCRPCLINGKRGL